MQTQTLALSALPDLPQTETLKRVAARLWADPNVAALWLGGSFARGEADRHSDIDLRVAVRPDALAQWQEADLSALSTLLGETVAGGRPLRWEGTVLHHLLLIEGVILDLLVQSVERDPPADFTFVLGCKDAAFEALLAGSALPPPDAAMPAALDTIREALVDFWINSHKHVRMLHRELDLLILTGLGAEQSVLMRLWLVEATGQDQATARATIHTLTPQVRAITAAFGPAPLQTLGAARTSRAEIEQVIEANRNAVAAAGRRLAVRLGFDYPVALEQTVRQAWAQYMAIPEFGRRTPGQSYRPRPGAYALLFDAQGRVAVMETPHGGFLPGGGIEAGETPEEALRREVREECGLEVGGISRFGEAVQYLSTPGYAAGIRKECVFFRVSVTGVEMTATEPDHILRWLTPAEAEVSLAHESQVWAVRRAISPEASKAIFQ